MNDLTINDPYKYNILTEGLGPVCSRETLAQHLLYLPEYPGNMADVPYHIRMHQLMSLRDLHVPTIEGLRVAETIDLMIRQGYRYRNPHAADTWSTIYGAPAQHKTPRMPPMATAVVSHSGAGKTEAILRALSRYPKQVVIHEEFPRVIGSHSQVVWMSIDVPPGGKAKDLASSLMSSWDELMVQVYPDKPRRFTDSHPKSGRDAVRALDEWRQVAKSHFLGALHLDEVQNFFRIPTLEKRNKLRGSAHGMELSIVEDECLKWVLSLTNQWGLPVVVSGTPDGVGALMKRFSNTQRFVSSGYHHLPIYSGSADIWFRQFMSQLVKYQFVQKPLHLSDELADIVMDLSGGIHRLIVALWFAAHRVAFERQADDLRLEDFKLGAATLLAPIAPAVAALRSNDPNRMARYEDLMTGDADFWSTFWVPL